MTIKRTQISLMMIGIAALANASAAVAAPGPSLPVVGSPTSLSAGVFVPSGGDAKATGGSTQLSVNFNYTVPVPNPLNVPTRTLVTLGVESGSTGGNHSTIIPLTVTQVVTADGGSPTAAGSLYFGLGTGVFFMNQSGLSTAARIGFVAQAGYNITSGAVINATYQGVAHGNGVSVNLGLRF